ncbi:MAG: hypothetical protein R2800_05270 [Flavipsychrobacter sp.]
MKTFGKKSLLFFITILIVALCLLSWLLYNDAINQWKAIVSFGFGLFLLYKAISDYVYFTVTTEELIMKMPFKKKEFKYAISDIEAVTPIREENYEGKKTRGALTIFKKDRTKETYDIPLTFLETRHLLMELRNYVEIV